MNYFLKRLAEPSSHAGLAGVIGAIAGGATGTLPWAAVAVTAFPALLAIFMPEKQG